MQFKVTNFADHEARLRRRGSLTLWVTVAAIDAWIAAPRPTRGGQATYSDSAIQTCLMLRTVFKLALCHAEGLMTSIVELLGCEFAVPDHTTVSRRAITLLAIARAALPESLLLEQIPGKIEQVTGDGAYDGEPTWRPTMRAARTSRS